MYNRAIILIIAPVVAIDLYFRKVAVIVESLREREEEKFRDHRVSAEQF